MAGLGINHCLGNDRVECHPSILDGHDLEPETCSEENWEGTKEGCQQVKVG